MQRVKPKIWKPRRYQIVAACFLLVRPFSGLFLDPGLGKTSTTLWVLKILKYLSKKRRATLLIAPKSVMWLTWPNEIKKWKQFNKLTFCILHGDMKDYLLWNAKTDIYLMNPDGLPWLSKALLRGLKNGRKMPFDILWIDESTKFKNHKTKTRFEVLEDLLPLFKRRHIMTGTPAAKSMEDLWAQIFIVDRGKALGDSFHAFRNRHWVSLAKLMPERKRKKLANNDWRRTQYVPKKGEDLEKVISKRISHMILEMSGSEYLELPPLIYNKIEVELPPKAMKQYRQMEIDALTYIEEQEVSTKSALSALIPCWQIANGCVYESVPESYSREQIKEFMKSRKTLKSHNAKVDRLVDLVDELQGKPVLIVYYFKHDLMQIRKALGKNIPAMGGQTKDHEMVALERDWNAGKIPILCGQPGRISHGLNLQEVGRDMIFFSLFWSPENRRQTVQRLWRQGVTSSVTIHDIIARGTVDEVMYSRWFSRQKAEMELRKLIKQYNRDKYHV